VQIVKRDDCTGFASAGMTKAEIVSHFFGGVDAPTDQDFQQEFEARGLKGEPLDAAAMDDEKTRHRVGNPKVLFRD
jgi:hypothetical protein